MPANTPNDNSDVINIADIAICRPLTDNYRYEVPDTMTCAPGQLVWVAIGSSEVLGIVLATDRIKKQALTYNIKPINKILPHWLAFKQQQLKWFHWCQDYYQSLSGDVLQNIVPNYLLKHEPPKQEYWQLKPPYHHETDEALRLLSRSKKQRECFQWLQQAHLLQQRIDGLSVKRAGYSTAILNALANKDIIQKVTLAPMVVERTACIEHTENKKQLNSEQKNVLANINVNEFKGHLIDGVTGSGKTEVYLQVMAEPLRNGRQILVLVPEIGLVEQTANRIIQRYGQDNVLCFHSAMTDKQRYDTWKAARLNEVAIIVGTRSSVFIEFANLGLIIVDEEHDNSYKQNKRFAYHARDIATKIAYDLNIPLLMGSATPSLESLHNVKVGKFIGHQLRTKAIQKTRSKWQLVPPGKIINGGISDESFNLLETAFQANQQALIFINRRGFAPSLYCQQCGWQAQCRGCDKLMTLHRRHHKLSCHRCDQHTQIPNQCPSCYSKDLQTQGAGTEQIELILQQRFPHIPIVRLDRDSTQRKNSFKQQMDILKSGIPAMLIGTQMVAKGHHLANLSTAIILDIDQGLYGLDFRAVEQTAQLITQVAGRAGREKHQGTIVLQTDIPSHEYLQLLMQENYSALAASIYAERSRQQLPPFRKMAILRAESHDINMLHSTIKNALSTCYNAQNIQLIGPIAAPTEKRQMRHRVQVQMLASQRSQLMLFCHELRQQIHKQPKIQQLRWYIDIDPMSID